MSKTNVAIMQLLDIVRSKQIILMMNAPTIQGVDKHVKRMSQMMIECLRLNKSKQFSTVKPLTLQATQFSSDPYKHRLALNGRAVHRCVLYKPNNKLTKLYEVKKRSFQDNVFEQNELDARAIDLKRFKDAGIKQKLPELVKLTDKQKAVYKAVNSLGSQTNAGKVLGLGNSTISRHMMAIKKKLNPVNILGN